MKKQAAEAVQAEKGEKPLDRDGEGRQLYAEDILGMLEAELARRKEERRPLELQWILNANFQSGHQYCDINPHNGEIFETEEGTARGAYNRIAPLIESRIANLKQLKYTMTVRPQTDDPDDEEKAKIATKLLKSFIASSDFEGKRNMLLEWTELCGTAFVLSWWDKDGGRTVGGDGAEEIREGELRYGLLTPYEVYPESIYKQDMEDQRSLLVEQVLTVEELYEMYGVRMDGGSVDTFALTPVCSGGGYGHPVSSAFALTYRKAENSVRLITWFERPGRVYPNGRLIIAAGNTLLHYGELPYGTIPVCSVKCKDVPGQFFGRSVITELIPLQRAYNGVKNKLHDHIRTLAANPLLVPEGSISELESLEDCGVTPGRIVEYNPERGKPSPLDFPDISGEVRLECESLQREMEYTAGVSQMTVVGNTAAGIISGRAIEKLQQIDSTRISLTGDNLRDAVKRLAQIWLGIFKRCAVGSRVVESVGTGEAGGALIWCASDINSFDVAFDTENELKYGDEAQKQEFFTALKLGLFNDEHGNVPASTRRRALELMRLGCYSELLYAGELHAKNAKRENSMLATCGIDGPGLYDDDEVHIEEHCRFAVGRGFAELRKKDPALAEAFDRHIALHSKRLQEGRISHTEEKKGIKDEQQY